MPTLNSASDPGRSAIPPVFVSIDDVRFILGRVSRSTAFEALKTLGVKSEEIYPGGPKRYRYTTLLASLSPTPEA